MIDEELKAIKQILKAMEPLEQRARNRVIRYICDTEMERELANVRAQTGPVGKSIFDCAIEEELVVPKMEV